MYLCLKVSGSNGAADPTSRGQPTPTTSVSSSTPRSAFGEPFKRYLTTQQTHFYQWL